jgi:hypothetical protein
MKKYFAIGMITSAGCSRNPASLTCTQVQNNLVTQFAQQYVNSNPMHAFDHIPEQYRPQVTPQHVENRKQDILQSISDPRALISSASVLRCEFDATPTVAPFFSIFDQNITAAIKNLVTQTTFTEDGKPVTKYWLDPTAEEWSEIDHEAQ